MMKRILTLTLAITMLAGCCAFSALAEEEPISATAIVFCSPGFTPVGDNYGTQYILENFNLDLEVLPVDSATDESWNIFWASGGYADIIVPYGGPQATNIIDEELCRPFDFALMKEHAPRLINKLLQGYGSEEALLQQLQYKGEVWCIPYYAETNSLSWITAIRNDWLEAVGLSVPTTIDEFTAMLDAFTYGDPDGNGVDDTYGAHGFDHGLYNVAAAFGTSDSLAFWVNDEGTDITTNALSEEYRDFLRQVNEWYAAGYIDPEFLTDDRAAVRSKWASGKLGILSDNPWWFEDERGATGPLRMLCDTDTSLDFSTACSFIGGLQNADGEIYTNSLFADIKGQASILFGYDCPDEVIVAVLNMVNRKVTLNDGSAEDTEAKRITAAMDIGIEGVDWEWDAEADKAVRLIEDDPQYRTENGIYTFPVSQFVDMAKFEGKVDSFLIEGYEMARNPNKIYRSNNFAKPVLSPEASDMYDLVSSYFTNCRNQFVTGEMSLDTDWDAYVAQMEEYGLQTIIDEYKAGLGI